MSQHNPGSGSHLRPGEFYGDVVGKRHGRGLVLSELTHAGRRMLPRHSHELAYFCLLLDGSYSETCGRRTISYKPWTIMFHPPGLTHQDEIGNRGGRFFSIEVDDGWLARLREHGAVPQTVTDVQGNDLRWLATRLYREYRVRDACSPLIIEGIVMEMLGVVARATDVRGSRPPSWLSRAVELLHAEFRQRLTVNHVAAEVGVHPFHLSRVFRRFHRQTVGEYVKQLRVRFACEQLSNPDATLAGIALAAGFSDQSHFTRVFRQITGDTPGQFRAGNMRGRARQGVTRFDIYDGDTKSHARPRSLVDDTAFVSDYDV